MNKKRFSFIDICIVVVAILLVICGILILKPGKGNGEQTTKINFTVLATNQVAGLSELVKPGEDVVISFSEDVHATVVEAYEEESKEYYFNNFTGKYVLGKLQGKSDVFVKLTCDATVSDTEISNGGLPIHVGDEMPVRGKGYIVKGYVVDVTEE